MIKQERRYLQTCGTKINKVKLRKIISENYFWSSWAEMRRELLLGLGCEDPKTESKLHPWCRTVTWARYYVWRSMEPYLVKGLIIWGNCHRHINLQRMRRSERMKDSSLTKGARMKRSPQNACAKSFSRHYSHILIF